MNAISNQSIIQTTTNDAVAQEEPQMKKSGWFRLRRSTKSGGNNMAKKEDNEVTYKTKNSTSSTSSNTTAANSMDNSSDTNPSMDDSSNRVMHDAPHTRRCPGRTMSNSSGTSLSTGSHRRRGVARISSDSGKNCLYGPAFIGANKRIIDRFAASHGQVRMQINLPPNFQDRVVQYKGEMYIPHMMGPSKEMIMIGVRQPSRRQSSSKPTTGQAAFFVFPPLEEIQDDLKVVGRIQGYVAVGINSHKHVQILPWGDQKEDSKDPKLNAIYVQDIFAKALLHTVDKALLHSDDNDSSPPSSSWCKFALQKKRSKVATYYAI